MIKKYYGYIAGFIFLVGLFYWFEFRPSQIRSICGNERDNARNEAMTKLQIRGSSKGMYLVDDQGNILDMLENFNKLYDDKYQRCLNSHGIK